jgi:hypothetical protein
MSGKRYKIAQIGRPALVCVTTGKSIIIDGKRYNLLKMMYDLEGKYAPPATLQP